MKRIDFWFDFISPFSYLAQQRLDELPAGVELVYRPVLFAGLLKHWGTVGPAETPSQRNFTYRYCDWLAGQHNIDYRTPPAHPFNPLAALRASIALQNTPQAVDAIYRFIWADGQLPQGDGWSALLSELGVSAGALAAPEVKHVLRDNTEQAIASGVFGVPTFSVDDELFFGQDALPMLVEYLREPSRVVSEEYRRLGELPTAVERSR